MFGPILQAGRVALALCFVAGSSASLMAQHSHHGGGGRSHHHHSGGGIYIGGGGIGIGYGSGFYGGGYRNYGYGGGFGYSSPSYGYRSGVYISPQVYVTPQYVAPAPRVVYQSSPTIIYQSPTVQSSSVTIESSRIAAPAQEIGQRTNLPGVTFGARAHLNVLSDALAERTTLLAGVLNTSYQGNPQFQEVYRDTELLAASARQIPSLAANSEALLAAVQDLNTLFNALSPAIESWRSTNGTTASGPLSSVKSALQLLSSDAGYDPNRPISRSVQSTVPPASIAPAAGRTSAPEPTPVDTVPAP